MMSAPSVEDEGPLDTHSSSFFFHLPPGTSEFHFVPGGGRILSLTLRTMEGSLYGHLGFLFSNLFLSCVYLTSVCY